MTLLWLLNISRMKIDNKVKTNNLTKQVMGEGFIHYHALMELLEELILKSNALCH